ncbi:hypothetical protein OsccyDRAFT_5071 [Leptolyngbyaceae cyanobacterium JSC-12]|nr:hypothetical protein OsccyDRAFT_5071 [Leptolyngbyaceae cyanobacterium JSC-12]
MQLYTLLELDQLINDQLQQDFACLLKVSHWVRNFLANSHPQLGRRGSVCPFIPRALQLDLIRMTVIRARELEPQHIEVIVKRYRDIFLKLEPNDENAVSKALLLIFPDIITERDFRLLNGLHKALKPYFIESGLMLGVFHPVANKPGLHNPNFYPFLSPVPLLAIRFMVPPDLYLFHPCRTQER